MNICLFMSSYTRYHTQATPENIEAVREEFWPVMAGAIAAAFAMLAPFLRTELPRAVLAQITAKLKPAEALARRIFLLQAMVAAEAATPKPQTQIEPPQPNTAPPRATPNRDPYPFKLTEPWPNFLPDFERTFEAGWADAAFANPLASRRTMLTVFKRIKALDAALKDPDKQIARMGRWLAKRADLDIGRKTPLALGPPPGWHRRRKDEPIMSALALTHQFQRMRFYPPGPG